MSFTKISEIGEFGLIEKLAKIVAPTERFTPQLEKGIGDDCAIIKLTDDRLQVVTTDLLIEHIHFDMLTTPLEHLGSKSISVNVSDICAMNAKPQYAVVSIALPQKISVEMMEAFYKGMAKAAEEYGIAIVGGDTSASSAGLVISVTLIGETRPEKVTRRSGARVGDLVCVSGELGGSHAGLRVLIRERSMLLDHLKEDGTIDPKYQPDLAEYQAAVTKHLLPKARLDIVALLEKRSIVPTAMIDISDGLASEIKHICGQSGTGAVLYEDKVPLLSEARHAADEFEEEAITYALFGGEDYELLFTVAPEDADKLLEGDDVKIIGEIRPKEENVKLLDIFGQEMDLTKTTGYQHFIPHREDEHGHDNTDGDADDEDIWGESEEN
ncbi:MAG: thiamine-phosphate kinase [Chlorobiales bacterium]|nr:thiamine-phosphate kinase [Chlorobiales bacterium]